METFFGTLEVLAQYVGLWQFPKPAHSEARKARKPSLQTMCPQQQRRMLNSLLLTSLSVNGYNPVIDQFFMHLAHRPSAYDEMHFKFCFLANLTFLIQMRSNVWRRNSSLSTKTAQRNVFAMSFFSLLFSSNDFLDYAEDTIDMTLSLQAKYR